MRKHSTTLCFHPGCKRPVPHGARLCEPHLRQAKTDAARTRLLGWLRPGRPER